METLVILIVILLIAMVVVAVRVDKHSKESIENLEIAVDKFEAEMQNLKRVQETYDREQEHL